MSSHDPACFTYQKHRGLIDIPGGAIFQDDLIYSGHAWPQEGDADTYLGACIVEPKRHVDS